MDIIFLVDFDRDTRNAIPASEGSTIIVAFVPLTRLLTTAEKRRRYIYIKYRVSVIYVKFVYIRLVYLYSNWSLFRFCFVLFPPPFRTVARHDVATFV